MINPHATPNHLHNHNRSNLQEMKASNCLTRSLYHWDRYGGSIMYDGNHAKICGGEREYIDPFELNDYIDAKSYGVGYFLSAHSDFLNEEEIEILNRYFKR